MDAAENPSPPASPDGGLDRAPPLPHPFDDQTDIRSAAALRLLVKVAQLHTTVTDPVLFEQAAEPVLAEMWEACAVPANAVVLARHGALGLLARVAGCSEATARTVELALGSLANLLVTCAPGNADEREAVLHALMSTLMCNNRVEPLCEAARALTAALRNCDDDSRPAWIEALSVPDVGTRVCSVLANALNATVLQRFAELCSAAVYAAADDRTEVSSAADARPPHGVAATPTAEPTLAQQWAACGVSQALVQVLREKMADRTAERNDVLLAVLQAIEAFSAVLDSCDRALVRVLDPLLGILRRSRALPSAVCVSAAIVLSNVLTDRTGPVPPECSAPDILDALRFLQQRLSGSDDEREHEAVRTLLQQLAPSS